MAKSVDAALELLDPGLEHRAPLAQYLARASGSPASPESSGGGGALDLLLSVGEECQTKEDLVKLLREKPSFNLYDGFEPSGRMHIAQGVFKAINVNKCTAAGGTFIFWVADWFGLMNDKMGGDLAKIRRVGEYFVEVWKATGMNLENVKFVWCSDAITQSKGYWELVLDVARSSTLARIKKCCTIMGRQDGSLTAAQILYPTMQCTDVFFLEADVCQLGVDQRKVNMLARDYCDAAKRKRKPVILSHHMLYGLKAGQSKMSKSDPDSAIFMEDTPEDVERKITNAFCPTTPQKSGADEDEMHLVKDDLKNPCLDYVKHIILSRPGATFSAGGVTYTSADDVKAKLVGGQLSEKDLKAGLVVEINKLLEPVRKHFTTDAGAKALLAEIAAYKKDPPKDPKFICRKPFAPQTTVVFAPLPTTTVRMDGVVRVLSALRRGAARGPCVLWLQDWTAFATNATNGDKNAIQAFYTLFTAALEGLDKALMARVKVEWQSAVAFAGASDYWLSVINVGRSVQVEELRKVFEADGQSLDTAGQVIGALLFGGDVLAASSAEGAQLYVDPGQAALAEFALGYVRGKTPLAPPALVPNDAQPLHLNDLANENAHLLTTDADMIVGSKLKKAFCEPGNTTFCPPLAFAHFLLGSGGEIVVKRKEENGGDKTYKDLAAIKADFLSGALHPGDLKPSVTKAVVASLAGVREVYKQAAVKKAQKDLETFAKKNATKDFRTGVQAVMAMNRMRSGSGQELEPKA